MINKLSSKSVIERVSKSEWLSISSYESGQWEFFGWKWTESFFKKFHKIERKSFLVMTLCSLSLSLSHGFSLENRQNWLQKPYLNRSFGPQLYHPWKPCFLNSQNTHYFVSFILQTFYILKAITWSPLYAYKVAPSLSSIQPDFPTLHQFFPDRYRRYTYTLAIFSNIYTE